MPPKPCHVNGTEALLRLNCLLANYKRLDGRLPHRCGAALKERASQCDLDRVVQAVPIIPLSLICLTCA